MRNPDPYDWALASLIAVAVVMALFFIYFMYRLAALR